MNDIIFLVVILAGALCGICGRVGENGVLTYRAIMSAASLGAALGLIVYLIMNSFFPDKTMLSFAIALFISLTRWATVKPACNCVFKCVYSIIYTFVNGRFK